MQVAMQPIWRQWIQTRSESHFDRWQQCTDGGGLQILCSPASPAQFAQFRSALKNLNLANAYVFQPKLVLEETAQNGLPRSRTALERCQFESRQEKSVRPPCRFANLSRRALDSQFRLGPKTYRCHGDYSRGSLVGFSLTFVNLYKLDQIVLFEHFFQFPDSLESGRSDFLLDDI